MDSNRCQTKYITYDNSPHTQTVVGVVPEQTTTLSSTTTSTRFVTVPYVKPTGTPAKPADETVDENSPIGDDEEECPPPVTVTVAATTIYETITFTPPAAAPTKPAGGATPIESVSDNDNVRGDASATTDCPEDEATAPATPIESVKNNAGLGGEAKPTTTATPVESVDNNAGTGATSTTDCPLDEQTAAPVPTEEDVEEEAEIVNETVYVIPTKAAATDPRPTGFITKARDTGSSITPAPTGGVYY